MQLRTRGWAGLVVAGLGLAIVAAGLLMSGKPSRSSQQRAQDMAPIVLDAAPSAAPGSAATARAIPAATPAPVSSATVAASDQRLVIKRILPISGPIRYGQWHWDEAGVPPGQLVITVDLDARVLSVFRDGYEIAATAVLLGTQEKPTPLGIFPITQKDADHKSNIYDGAPMPYMMRLTNDGVSIHGTEVQNGFASHGCVGVPTPFAKKLFGIAQRGTPVYITRGKMVGVGASLTS